MIRLVVYMINQLTAAQIQPSATLGLDLQILRMGTGLDMQVFTLGPEDGMPVLFLHGMLEGVAVLRHLEDVLSAAGLRVVAPIRPGYGQSDQCRKMPVLETFLAHTQELLSRVELQRPVVLGHLAGGFHGHVLCHRIPEKLSGMLALGAVAPVRSRLQLADMAPRQKIVAFTARYLPSFLPTILRAGVAQIDSMDVQNFMGGLYPDGSHDHAVIMRLEIASLIQAGYRLSVHQGHFGFLGDAPYMVRDWSDLLTCERPPPIVYLMGAEDHVNRPHAVRAGFEGIEGIALHEVPKAGQLMFYEHPQLVIAALRELYEAAN
ncbi:alpha/beta fold hydrolase [Roseovarius sp. C7]|uniref:alpha/beta fold hydrolase n=1 Tax=Roseovarius sp. C7 TaxID=3398643 RepID=UPI0039F5CA62